MSPFESHVCSFLCMSAVVLLFPSNAPEACSFCIFVQIATLKALPCRWCDVASLLRGGGEHRCHLSPALILAGRMMGPS